MGFYINESENLEEPLEVTQITAEFHGTVWNMNMTLRNYTACSK